MNQWIKSVFCGCPGVSRFNILSVAALFVGCVFLAAQNLSAADFYVSPSGTSSGDGSWDRPWNLETALRHPVNLQPGDTIWLRGGIYRKNKRATKFLSELHGAANNPVTLRQYPGERAIIDGNVTHIAGGWVNYWGFEIMNSIRLRTTKENGPFPKAFWLPDGKGKKTDLAVSGFDLRAPHVKLINLTIHDSIGGGIFISTNAVNPEIYGTLCFYNGWQGGDRGHGHGIYAQSVSPSVAKIEENLFFSNYALGFQATGTGPVVDNLELGGNILFLNSVLSRQHQGNLLIGPFSGAATGISLIRNFIYETDPSGSDCNIGYVGGIVNGRLIQNYLATKVAFSDKNQNIQMDQNVILSGQPPSEPVNLVEVRPNKYESGRATILIYNWSGDSEMPIDLRGVFQQGATFEIRNAQDVLGPPVMKGIYQGGLLNLPLTNLFVAKPRMTNPSASTAPEFNVFILQADRSGNDSANMPPTVSIIKDQTTYQNTLTRPIRINIRDPETSSEFLNVSVSSSNSSLVPHGNFHFTGSDSARTVRIMPAPHQLGKSVITLAVSDGFRTTTRSFVLSVISR